MVAAAGTDYRTAMTAVPWVDSDWGWEMAYPKRCPNCHAKAALHIYRHISGDFACDLCKLRWPSDNPSVTPPPCPSCGRDDWLRLDNGTYQCYCGREWPTPTEPAQQDKTTEPPPPKLHPALVRKPNEPASCPACGGHVAYMTDDGWCKCTKFGCEWKHVSKKPSHDPVNHPSHYCRGGLEVLDAIEAWGLNYRLGNVVKYVARAGHKGDRTEDLRKAAFYLNREIERGNHPCCTTAGTADLEQAATPNR